MNIVYYINIIYIYNNNVKYIIKIYMLYQKNLLQDKEERIIINIYYILYDINNIIYKIQYKYIIYNVYNIKYKNIYNIIYNI